MTRWFAFVAFALATAAAFLFWSWLGRPQAIAEAGVDRVACLSYSPFRTGQTPFDPSFVVPRAQIEEDMRILAERTGCVRSYAVNQGLEVVPEAAKAAGLEVVLGAWLGRDPEHNVREISTAVALANAHPETVRAIVVGNEALLRGEIGADALAALLRDARSRTEIPVTYADVWEFWIRNGPALVDAVDFVTVHILPYWEDDSVAIDHALSHVGAVIGLVEEAFPGKPVMIGEVGWPSAGRMRDGALPSRVNQARFIREFVAFAEGRQLRYNLIEAFDQPWKRALEGTVGGHWGLYDPLRRPKFDLSGPVSNHPQWMVSFLSATLFAVLPILWAAARRPLPYLRWLALAVLAQAAAVVLVLQGNYALLTSRTAASFAIAATGLSVTAVTGWLLLDAFARSDCGAARTAPLRAVLSWLRFPRPAGGSRATVLGALRLVAVAGALAASLGLVFDARYRDFPTVAFLVPAIGFALAAWACRRDGLPEAGREESWLAALLVACAIAIAVVEGPLNLQALAWAATCLLLAAPWGLRMATARRAAAASA